jgi:hypothetical protein
MRRYKTKETAIRNIRKGRSFNRIEFYPFWKDKEVCWEALAHGSISFPEVQRKFPGIEWDSEFMDSLFIRMLEINPSDYCMSDIGPYLTPKITDSKEIAIRAAEIGLTAYQMYSAPDLFLDEDVINACKRKVHYSFDDRMFKTRLTVEAVQHLNDNTDLLEHLVIACPELYWSLPDSLRMNRRVSIAICIHTGSFRYVHCNYHDDEEFVLDALLGYGIRSRVLMFRTSSYRIRKAVGDNDPIEFLKAAALTKRLEASLSHKTEDTMSKVNRVKI